MAKGAVLPLLLRCAAAAGAETVSLVAEAEADLVLSGGAQVTSNPLRCIRSGSPGQRSSAAFRAALNPGATVRGVSLSYQYVSGFGPSGIGANFSVRVAGTVVYASPHFTDYSYDANRSGYSPAVPVDAEGVDVAVGDAAAVEIDFDNNGRNVQLLLPLTVNLTCDGGPCLPAPTPAPPPPPPLACAPPALCDLFHQLDSRLPGGFYRIPSLVATGSGALLAFVMGRMHRTDATPNIVYLRRSLDDGRTWGPAQQVLNDPTNRTEYGGAPVVDPATGVVHFIHNQGTGRGCSACPLWVTSSADDGATWSPAAPVNFTGAANTTWGGALASGIVLTKGPHRGRLLVALRHDCGCGDLRTSFVVYSDDHGATWTGGEEMVLIPEFGGGWTECQVAELANGSVLMTSRNFYGKNSGQGPRLFARSDDGGETWAANWSAGTDLPDPYCEASILSDTRGGLYFGNPSSSSGRRNFMVHQSHDGGLTWPVGKVVYPGGAEYSDMAFTRNGDVAVLFEKDVANTVAFGVVPLPLTSD